MKWRPFWKWIFEKFLFFRLRIFLIEASRVEFKIIQASFVNWSSSVVSTYTCALETQFTDISCRIQMSECRQRSGIIFISYQSWYLALVFKNKNLGVGKISKKQGCIQGEVVWCQKPSILEKFLQFPRVFWEKNSQNPP